MVLQKIKLKKCKIKFSKTKIGISFFGQNCQVYGTNITYYPCHNLWSLSAVYSKFPFSHLLAWQYLSSISHNCNHSTYQPQFLRPRFTGTLCLIVFFWCCCCSACKTLQWFHNWPRSLPCLTLTRSCSGFPGTRTHSLLSLVIRLVWYWPSFPQYTLWSSLPGPLTCPLPPNQALSPWPRALTLPWRYCEQATSSQRSCRSPFICPQYFDIDSDWP